MPNSNKVTEQLIARAKLGEEAALVNLIGQVGPQLRRAIDVELEAVQHGLDAGQVWSEIQEQAKQRVSGFEGTTETEFEAWAERLAVRHIRYSLGRRAGNNETLVNTHKPDTALATLAQTLIASKTPDVSDTKPTSSSSSSADPHGTIAPGSQKPAACDPNATVSPGKHQTTPFDPHATFAPGDGDTIAPNASAAPKFDPHATITDLAAIPLAPQTTKIFGDYEILETIAKGGMGVVYKARQRKLNRIVALKMILAGQFADQEDIDRFYVEAEAAAQLRHPNIVGIFEVGECDGQHYFSMEYIEGQSLGDLVREHPLAPRAAAKFVKTISEAMYYAHQEGVLHRDLKPSNILVDDSEVPLITDFGLAKRTEEQSQRTAAGSVLGTPSYMPPEQASGKLDLISERSDVYSIGAILYELITGKPPFGAANPWETIKQVLSNEPVSPRLLNNSVPADLETICLKCLQKDQARRYDTAQDLADELQRFLAGEPILARPIGVVERSVRWCYRNPWPTAALAVLLLGVFGTTVGLVQARIAQRQAEMSRDQLLAAINELFTAWGDVTLLNEPGFEEVRAQLLATASNLYKQMGEQLGEDPKVQHELGVSYFRLGRMMFHLRSYHDARETLAAGLEIQRDLHAARPADEARLHALGESLNLMGNVLEVIEPGDIEPGDNVSLSETQQRLEQAEFIYDEAIAARTELVKRFPENPEYARQLLNSRMNRGMVRRRMGGLVADQEQFAEAKKFYEEARSRVGEVQSELRDLLARLDATSKVRRDVIQDLAQCSYNMANVTWWLGDLEATGEHVAAAVGAFETLLAAEPNHLENQYDQAHCLMLGGDAKNESMRLLEPSQSALKATLYQETLAAYERAKAILERLASKSTSVPKYHRAVAQVYLRIGDLHLENQQDQQALDAYQSAADVLTPLVPDVPAFQQFLDDAQSGIALAKQYIKESARPEATLPADGKE